MTLKNGKGALRLQGVFSVVIAGAYAIMIFE